MGESATFFQRVYQSVDGKFRIFTPFSRPSVAKFLGELFPNISTFQDRNTSLHFLKTIIFFKENKDQHIFIHFAKLINF
jgi:hypothetical protein